MASRTTDDTERFEITLPGTVGDSGGERCITARLVLVGVMLLLAGLLGFLSTASMPY